MTVIDEVDSPQTPDPKSLTCFDYVLIVPIGFLSFIVGWFANLYVQSTFHFQFMSDIWDNFYNEILGYPGFLLACILGPFIAAFLAVISSSIISLLFRNKVVTYISTIVITAAYGFSPLSGFYLSPLA